MWGAFFQYGLVLQAVAILHFVRRRPDTYWMWIIIAGGGLGALAYIVAEVIPDAGLLRGAFEVFPRRQRIRLLETAILDNPAVANYEELGDLYLDEKQFGRARECFDRVISRQPNSPHSLYHRALCHIGLGDLPSASADLQLVVELDAKYDYHRARGLLAHTLAKIGQREKAASLFAEVTEISTLSETQYNYACFLAEEGRTVEAREWAERLLAKKRTMPAYLRRKERPWFRKAAALVKRLPR